MDARALPILVGIGQLVQVMAVPTWVPAEFRLWAKEHGKHYASEHSWRRALDNYQSNQLIVDELNSDAGDGAEYGHSQFSDLRPYEFQELTFPASMDPVEGKKGGTQAQIPNTPAPAAVDWRAQGAVTPVKDQQACGSCWAESAVSNMESMWYLANKGTMSAPVQFSVQQVIECDSNDKDNACYGGFPKGAYKYVIEHGGITTEAAYPYNVDGHVICLANQTFNETCGDGMCDDPPLTNTCDETCSDEAPEHKPVATFSSWHALPSDEDAMAAYVAQNGPISVGIDASGGAIGVLFPWMQFYKRGIANPRRCTTTINHAVVIVGFGEENSQPYWLIKNSWGMKWGESGYFRLVRGIDRCGIADMATSVVVTQSTAVPSILAPLVV